MASIDRRPNGTLPGALAGVSRPARSGRRHFDRKADAQRFLDALRGDLARGIYIDPASGRMPFRAYAEEWRAAQMHRPSTASQCETYLRLHAYPTLGDRPIGSIRRSEIQAWVKDRSARPRPRLGRARLPLGGDDLQGGRRRPAHRLRRPASGSSSPSGDHGEITPLEVEAVEALADAVPPPLPGARSSSPPALGLRQGECFGLTVDRVDFLRRQVRVDRQLVGARPASPEFGPPKSQAGFRTVPDARRWSTEALAAHLAAFGAGPERPGVHQQPRRARCGGTPSARSGTALLPPAGLPPGATFHDLRHFYASLLIAHGCSVKAVQRRLGHQSAMETLDTYSHSGRTATTRPARQSTRFWASHAPVWPSGFDRALGAVIRSCLGHKTALSLGRFLASTVEPGFDPAGSKRRRWPTSVVTCRTSTSWECPMAWCPRPATPAALSPAPS